MTRLYLAGALALLCAACNDAATPVPHAPAQPETGNVVDSIFPMDVMIARFQASMLRQPHDLGADAPTSRDELVARFVRAVADSSMTALRALRLDAPEFAFLYFPTSRWAADPYRQPPAIAWMMIEQNGLKGEARLLRRYGGRDLQVAGYTCEETPVVEGGNRLWEQCTVRVAARTSPLRLFGSVLERGGRFKFVSLANDL